MQYQEARLLHSGDKVVSKKDGTTLTVKAVQIYSALKTVRIHVVDEFNNCFSVLNNQIK
jgi:hypothetical protein